MLSLGWSEIAIVIIIVVLVVGPKELPNIIKQFGYFSKKIKSLSREFNTSINNIVKEVEIDQVKKKIDEVSSLDIEDEILKNTDTKSEFDEINTSLKKLNKNTEVKKNNKNK